MDAITGLDGLLNLRCKNKRSLLGKPCLKVPSQVRAGSVAASSLVHPPSQVTLPPRSPLSSFKPSPPHLLLSQKSVTTPLLRHKSTCLSSMTQCKAWANTWKKSQTINFSQNSSILNILVQLLYFSIVLQKAINLLSGRNLNVSLPSFFSESIKIIVTTQKDSWRPYDVNYDPHIVQNVYRIPICTKYRICPKYPK